MMRFVEALTAVSDVDAEQVYEPPCVRLIFGIIRRLPLCKMAELSVFFHVINGFGHPLATQVKTTGSVSFSVIDGLGR